MSATPTIYYPTAFRGRAETIKLALAAKGLAWQQVGVTADDAKSDRVRYPFAQFPRFVDDQVDMVQKNAILRHIARRWGLYGDGSLAQAAQVDEWLEGCETMRGLHFKLIYVDKLSDESKKAFWDLNLDRASEARKEGTKPRGAHWFYLERLLERNGGGKGFCVGSQLTVADLEIFELFDIFTRIFPSLRTEYPVLAAHTDRISQVRPARPPPRAPQVPVT